MTTIGELIAARGPDALDPHRLGAQVPDEFAPEGQAGETKAKAVLKVLLSANLKTTFGFDLSSAEELWGSKLARFDTAALLDAANIWVSSPGDDFPTLAEFVVLAESAQRR